LDPLAADSGSAPEGRAAGIDGSYLQMQNDGNLVLYTDFRTVLWACCG
jgi:hypothetical protein